MLPLLADPTDQIVQNEMTVFGNAFTSAFSYWIPEQGVENMKGFPVPRALVGQHEWYGLLPRKLGPMALFGGEVVFPEIGDLTVPAPVDRGIAWINQNLGTQIGGYAAIGPDIIGPAETANSFIVAPDDPLDDTDKIMLPRKPLGMGNLAGKRTFPKMPTSYFDKELVEGTIVESTQRWTLSGQTLNSTGAPTGGCRVLLFDTSKMIAGAEANPILMETISDGSGNYSFIVPRQMGYQLTAYLPGSPDIAGVTRNDVQPVVL
jgi:hypothetical protein